MQEVDVYVDKWNTASSPARIPNRPRTADSRPVRLPAKIESRVASHRNASARVDGQSTRRGCGGQEVAQLPRVSRRTRVQSGTAERPVCARSEGGRDRGVSRSLRPAEGGAVRRDPLRAQRASAE